MNLNTNLSLNPAAVLPFLKRYYRALVGLAILGLVGFTGYQLSRIFAVQPNATYITLQERTVGKTPNLRANQKVLLQLTKLQPVGSVNAPVSVGKSNPFSLGN